jgi:ketosteroid isomerase-like protein
MMVKHDGSRKRKGRGTMSKQREKAMTPEQLTRFVVERVNAGDAKGVAELYEPEAVVAFPPGETTVGRDAIRAMYQQLIDSAPEFKPEDPLPTIEFGELALTATHARDEAGARAQVVRRQPDGSWLRLLDRPDFRG